MTNTTKLALEAALKKELLTKSLDKITINELAEDCGISRMAFYYHFKDIYDLVEWFVWKTARRHCRGRRPTRTGRKASVRFSSSAGEQTFHYECLRCVDRQKIESYLNKLTYQLIADVVEENAPACR